MGVLTERLRTTSRDLGEAREQLSLRSNEAVLSEIDLEEV
jgi:hypothetical protein